MRFLYPWVFPAGLLPAAVMIFIWFRAGRKKQELLCRWFGSVEVAKKHIIFSPLLRSWKYFLVFTGFLLLVTAAAGPWWGYHRVSTARPGRDIAIVFDVSKSMLAEDTAPSRLEHGRWLAGTLVSSSPGDRFALIPFAGMAATFCPLTLDQNTFRMILDSLDIDVIPHGGTDIAAALRTAAAALQEAPGREKAILLITDGEELTGDASAETALLRQEGITLLIAGIGSDTVGAPIPEKAENGNKFFKRDASGNIITTRLSPELLKKLAQDAGGRYFYSTAVDDQLGAINAAISELAAEAGAEEFKTIPIPRFMPFLAVGALLLLLGTVLPERNPGRKIITIFLLIMLPSTLSAADALALYNQGAEIHNSDPVEAENFYQHALTAADLTPDVASNILLNTGNLRHNQARTLELEAEKTLSSDLSGAIKQLQQALDTLSAASEAYTGSLAEYLPPPEAIQGNIRAWNDDRERMGKRKEELEKLLKQQQEARDSARDAARENQEHSAGQDASGEAEQQQTEKAAGAAKSLAEAARQAGADSMAEQAASAAEDLQEAADAGKQQDHAKAAEKIESAIEKLSGRNNGREDTPGEGTEQQGEVPKNGETAENPQEPAFRGNALLKQMEEREEALRKAVQQMNSGRIPRPEKDW